MSVPVYTRIRQLVAYALRHKLIGEEDRIYITNSLLSALKLSEYTEEGSTEEAPLEEILSALCDYAVEQGLIETDSVVFRDLFDTSLMGIVTPRPGEVIRSFTALYALSPKAATDYFYKLCQASDYIRTYRVEKDVKWTYSGEYGELDIDTWEPFWNHVYNALRFGTEYPIKDEQLIALMDVLTKVHEAPLVAMNEHRDAL